MNKTLDLARRLLSGKNLKLTPQRLAITDFLLHTEAHPTADEVYEAVKDQLPACSKATIYNTLTRLADTGVIHAISTEPGTTRYDANMNPHHHFIDTQTGEILDIPWEQVRELFGTLGEEYRIYDYQVNFFGTRAATIAQKMAEAQAGQDALTSSPAKAFKPKQK